MRFKRVRVNPLQRFGIMCLRPIKFFSLREQVNLNSTSYKIDLISRIAIR